MNFCCPKPLLFCLCKNMGVFGKTMKFCKVGYNHLFEKFYLTLKIIFKGYSKGNLIDFMYVISSYIGIKYMFLGIIQQMVGV